jgi:hypothetical protein
MGARRCQSKMAIGRDLRQSGRTASVDPTEARNRFIETAVTLAIGEDRLSVAIDRRCHKPIFQKAALDRDPLPIP